MSWLLNLYETYKANLNSVGVVEKGVNEREFTLLPVSHTTQNAHIEVRITEDGEYHSAEVIEKNEASTLIPSTEKSASRAGAVVAPYPLHDKLSYVAGDFRAYGGKIKEDEPFAAYIQELRNWAESPHAHPKIQSIYRYLSKRRLIQDLVAEKILCVDEKGHLIDKWDKKYETLYPEKPKIFGVLAGEQDSAFVRFTVYSPERLLTEVWKDPDVYESFIRYYREQLGSEDICYVTGERLPATDKHANKIRNAADKAKLISANDKSGFTFRGRFSDSGQAASISYEVSQKAHNALKWLINRQGKVVDQRVFLIWGNKMPDVPDLSDDTFALDPEAAQQERLPSGTNPSFAREHAKAMDGFQNRLTSKYKDHFRSEVNILILDSATTGRMAVLYYRNMNKELYLEKLIGWHSTCVWLHRYRKNEQNEYVQYYGAPATKDIAFAAYGPRAGDKLIKGLMERMLPCILDGDRIPADIERSAIQRASNPVALEKWEWEKTLSIACALINRKERYPVALNKEITDRSYLFGRLLAVADVLERSTLDKSEVRATNAIRYMNAFSSHPERAWRIIHQSLQPYLDRLGANAKRYTMLLEEISTQFNIDDFNNKPLSGKYLLGYYSQRYDLYQKKEKNEDAIEASDQEERA
ncbi:type I-C CRISPR-associated protein Cas8c/Csd1 [Paenibacillus chitinolyticus]